MRYVFCAALALLPSAAWAERINITAASATYWTATDELEIIVRFDAPFPLTRDFFSVYGDLPIDNPHRTTELFSIRNDESATVVSDVLKIQHVSYEQVGPRVIHTTTPMGTVDYVLTDRSITITFPFEQTGLSSPLFRFGAYISTVGPGGYNSAIDQEMYSAIDRRVVYTPEPSSVALAGIGVVLFGIHLWRRPRFRQCFGKRHVRGKPAGETIRAV